MAGKKGVRPIITLACSECKERNYTSEKNRRNDPNRLEMSKYCMHCKKHTLHRETK
jgi:large subunit ribosomal protein L33